MCSLASDAGIEFVWQAEPAWPRHAPLLFPIVGRLANDELRHRGRSYRMTQHGFARDSRFAWVERGESRCVLMLEDSETTRERYPFAFRLAVTYRLEQSALDVTLAITNAGEDRLPASIGAHPAFNWPLVDGIAKDSYRLTFSDEESMPVRRLKGGLLRAKSEPSPIRGKTLVLSESLFDDDAIILDRLASRFVVYAADRGPSLEVSWNGFRQLGIWSKPGGAPFLCIEPWRGFASPVDFEGEFADKPGVMQIAPGASQVLSYRIGIR